MTIIDVEKYLKSVETAMNAKKITPNEAVAKVHAKNDEVFSQFKMYIDNDLYRNGIFNTKQAKTIDPNLTAKADDWFEVYRPWGTTHDLVRPVDNFSVSVALNQMILAIELNDYKETEQMYDMEQYGNKYASLADC